eukprot:1364125-Amorphochlora_amoeboformis.AAC.1
MKAAENLRLDSFLFYQSSFFIPGRMDCLYSIPCFPPIDAPRIQFVRWGWFCTPRLFRAWLKKFWGKPSCAAPPTASATNGRCKLAGRV